MLVELNIKNFALIQELSVEFGAGFNILSGETGAGKSILIDTIDYVLGGKFSKDQIRYGEDKTMVEAVFSIENDEIYEVLDDLSIEKDDMLIIRRETTLNGKSIIKVNNRSIVLSQLKKIREKLLDIHGQHQNQNLLNKGTHILYVDEFYHDKIKDLLNEYEELRHTYIENSEKINELKGNEDREKLADYIKFQIEDIEKANLKVNEEERTLEANGKVYTSEDYISIDGSTGNVYGEAIKAVTPEISGHFATFMEWADNIRKLSVRTNADNPRDTKQAIEFGAEGIGLCRTEHMFFEEDRIMAMREMIVAKNEDERRAALAKLLPMQKKDFIGMYEALKGMPATIRFLDPPLHEFLPHTDDEIAELAKTMGLSFGELKSTVENLHEFNPMMGHRGCRLDVSYPEIAEMQTRAVIEAAIEVKKNKGYDIVPEIMIPLVGEVKELKFVKDIVVRTAEQVMEESGVKLDYHVGTMIEIPRAALTADDIAKEAEFFSFGTNDLTQMTFGFSRDDAAKFLSDYYERKIYEQDPFAKLDQKGVGQLVKIAVEKGKSTRPNIKLGICGEHGGDPSSVEFCHNIGLNYVSCSPFRVPVARLAAAQAQVKNPRK